MPIRLFDSTVSLLEKVLDVRSARHRSIAANIANQDTPGYKAAGMDFKDALKSAGASQSSLTPVQTDPRHLSAAGGIGSSTATHSPAPKGHSTRLDGNTVDGEREMVDLAENSLMYNTSAQMISSKFKMLMNAIREGR